MKPSRLFSRLWILLPVLAWSAVILLGLEVVAHAQLAWIERTNPLVRESRDRIVHYSAAFDSSLWEDPWWSYRPNASLEADIDGDRFSIQTNSQGFRSPEVEIPKPPGYVRIVCIGGSTTVEGRTNESTYPAILEQRLRERFETEKIEVINCGISSLTTRGEFQKMPLFLEYEPDLIVEYNFINDFWRVGARLIRTEDESKSRIRKSLFLNDTLNERLLPPDAELIRRLERGTFQQPIGIVEMARAAGAEVALCSFALPAVGRLPRVEHEFFEHDLRTSWEGRGLTLESYDRWVSLYNSRLRRFSQENGCLFVPVAETATGGADVFMDLCHMTPKGIEAKAKAVDFGVTEFVAGRIESISGDRD